MCFINDSHCKNDNRLKVNKTTCSYLTEVNDDVIAATNRLTVLIDETNRKCIPSSLAL